jgi:hypothetical protein
MRQNVPSVLFLSGRVRTPSGTAWSSDGQRDIGGVESFPVLYHGRHQSISVVSPPVAVLFQQWERERL